MSEFNISIPGGESKRLLTGGKYCPADILVTAEGGGVVAVEEKDVNFYDYDGTLLYSYTLAEAQELKELPPAPTPPKDFLEFQEWNWTLSQIKSLGRKVDVGAVYVPTDDNTRLIFDIFHNSLRTVTITFKTWDVGTTIDWGDGSQSTTGTGLQTVIHQYASTGVYTVKIIKKSTSNNAFVDMGNVSTLNVVNLAPGEGNLTLKEVYLATNVRCTTNAFRQCLGIELITIPRSNTTQIWGSAFAYCRGVKAFVFPSSIKKFISYTTQDVSSVTLISLPYTFEDYGYGGICGCGSIKRHVVPPNATLQGECFSGITEMRQIILTEGITYIPILAFYQCFLIRDITVPKTVSQIGSRSFFRTTSLRVLRFLPEVPPVITNSDAFLEMPTECVVEVPAASLEVYKNATNYGSIAAQMVGV